jgi:[ribosomal protein S18]-alanine N-acetyltransferase
VIRPATIDDLAAITTIQDASPQAARWDPASYLGHHCHVVVVDEGIAGFLVYRETAPGEREILNVAVAPSHRRRGLASRLLEEVLTGSSDAWFLEVRESNTAALNLYKALGFQPAGRRENYYDNPAETAIVMRFFSWYCHGAQSAIGDRLR